jgi:hypothetical protein
MEGASRGTGGGPPEVRGDGELGCCLRPWLVVVGGWDSSFRRMSRVDALDCSAALSGRCCWRALPPTHAPRCAPAVCAMPDCHAVLVAGGGGEASVELLVCDGSGDGAAALPPRWEQLPPMSCMRSGAQAVALPGGRAIVFGGSRLGGRVLLKSVEIYTPAPLPDPQPEEGAGKPCRRCRWAEGSWRPLAPMQTARVNFGATAVTRGGGRDGGPGHVVVAGGELPPGSGGSTIAQSAEIYDVARNVWTSLPPLSVERFGCGAVRLGKVPHHARPPHSPARPPTLPRAHGFGSDRLVSPCCALEVLHACMHA